MGCSDSRVATTVLSQKDEIIHLRREKEEAEKCLAELHKNIKQIYETTDELAIECASLKLANSDEYAKFIEKQGNLTDSTRGSLKDNYEDVVKIVDAIDEIQNLNLKFVREFIGKSKQSDKGNVKGILKGNNLSGFSGKEIEETAKTQTADLERNEVNIERLDEIIQQLLKQHGNVAGRLDEGMSSKDLNLSSIYKKLEVLKEMAPKTQRTIKGIGLEMEELIDSYSKMQSRVTSLVESNRKELNLSSSIKFS